MSSAPSVATDTGITARPVIDAEVLAVLAAAVDQAWPRPRVLVTGATTSPSAWRFSGRWWSRPASSRRERPSTRG